MTERECKRCQQTKDADDFYHRNGIPEGNCKLCIKNSRVSHPRKSAWDGVDAETKKAIAEGIKDHIPITRLSKKYNISYQKLLYYKKQGWIKGDGL